MNIAINIDGENIFNMGFEVYAENTQTDFIPIGSSSCFTLVKTQNGVVKAWGTGRLGNGSNTAIYSTPTTVTNLSNVKQLISGGANFALLNNGNVKSWGSNQYGELGLGDHGDGTERYYPTTIPNLTGVKQISEGYNFILALMNDGTVKAWGDNRYLQLGDVESNGYSYRASPTISRSFTGIKQIAAGATHGLALKNDGTVIAWGNNSDGQLGLGNTNYITYPIAIPNLSGVVQIIASYHSSFALMNDGTVKAWGNNTHGELGLGDTISRNTPSTIGNLSNVKQLVANADEYFYQSHTLALLNNGTVKSWGSNYYGQLGQGDNTDRNTPTNIPGLSNVKELIAGWYHSIAIMNDGTVKVWGNNANGYLGLGDTVNRNTPTLLSGLILNTSPIINNISPQTNAIFSEIDTNVLPQISIADTENDNLLCKYYIDSETTPRDTKTVTNTLSAQNVTFSPINMSTLSDGFHTIKFEVSDNIDSPVISTISFKVDKSIPIIESTIIESSKNNVTIIGSATDSVSGLDPYPYRYTIGTEVTSWLTATSYTSQNPLTPNTPYSVSFEARDAKGHIATHNQSIYTKAEVPSISINNPSSYALDVAISDNNPAATQYQISVNNGAKYVTPEGTLTTSPIWFELNDKTINVSGLLPDTSYSFQAKARNGDGIETVFGPSTSGTTLVAPPGSPANIVVTATNNSITVIWDPVEGAVSYEIEADGNIIDNGQYTSYVHNGLPPSTQHTYRIRAINEGDPGAWSQPISKSTLSNAPVTPLNINAAATSTKVIITWDSVPGATGYDIEVDGKTFNNGSSTNYVHTGLLPGTTHSYRVKSINSGGKSNWSTETVVTTQIDTPVIPININTEASRTQITITWDAVAGATGYDIEVDGFIADVGNRTTYTHANLNSGTQHAYRVRSKKIGMESDWSLLVTASTQLDVFGTPSNVKAEAADTNISLSWDSVAEANGYDIEAFGIILDNGTDTSCIFSGLVPNTEHAFKVRAKNGDVTSEWCQQINISTYALPATRNVTFTSTINTITASWQAVSDSTSYTLDINGTVVDNVTTTSYTFENLDSNSQYIIKVKANNNTGTSAWNEPLTAYTLSDGNAALASMFAMAKTNCIRLIWLEVDGATGYDLEADGTVIENITDKTYLHNGLLPGTEHTYRLRVKKGSDVEAWSLPLTVGTLSIAPAVPENLAASSTINSVLITWDAVDNAIGYEIEINNQIIDVGQGTSYLDTGLNADTQYSYKIRSRNSSDTSAWSSPITIKTKNSTQIYTLLCEQNDTFNLILSASNLDDPGRYTFTITYNANELEVLDLCGTTSRIDLSTGNIIGTDIRIVQFTPGTIVLSKTSTEPTGQGWSGVVDSIKFKSKIDGQSSVVYTIN